MKTNTLDFDAQALRERILDLAMRGKLVPQDPNDEPASVLLEKIKAEKEELVKEKKIKKSKPLPAITDDEKPFDIPNSWEWVRLGEIGTITSGGTPKKTEKSYWENGNIPWITPATMSVVQNDIMFNNKDVKKINQNGLDHSSAHLIPANSIVVSSRAPIGYTNIVPFDYTTNQGCKSVSTYSDVVNEYVYYSIKFSVPDMYKRASGTTFKEISGTKFGETIIPFPPLSEQSRIAAKIAQLFALLRKVESSTQQYAELQTLLKSKVLDLAMRGKLVKQDPNDEPASVLVEKIKAEKAELVKEKKIKKSKPLPPITDEEKPFNIPDSWEWVRLGNITHFVGTGMVVPASKQYNTPKSNMVPYFKMNNIGNWNGKFNTNNLVYIIEDDKTDKYLLKPGQLLFNTRNSRELVGKTTVVPANLNQKIVSNNNILRIESFHNMKLDYLNYYLISSASRNHFLKLTTATTNVAAIYQKQLINCLVPLPPIAEQRRMVNKILDLYKLI